MKTIKKAGKIKPIRNSERKKIKKSENYVKEATGQIFSQIDGYTGSLEDSWGNVKETLLDILNISRGRMEIAPSKPWITQAIIIKMEERRNAKTKKLKSIDILIIN